MIVIIEQMYRNKRLVEHPTVAGRQYRTVCDTHYFSYLWILERKRNTFIIFLKSKTKTKGYIYRDNNKTKKLSIINVKTQPINRMQQNLKQKTTHVACSFHARYMHEAL